MKAKNGEEEVEELKEEEKMKNKKTLVIDGIPMEAWKYAEDTLWKYMIELLGQVWRQGEIPEDWKQNIIVPYYIREQTQNR